MSSRPTRYRTGDAETDDLLNRVLDRIDPPADRDQLFEILVTATRLAGDGAGRLDLKITNGALKEMRSAFRAFAPYRHVPKVTIFGSARTRSDDPAYDQARVLAKRMAAQGWMVVTGAGPGIMAAGLQGAGRERSFGVNIRLPFEQEPNEFIAKDPKLVTFRYFFTRKVMFVKEADAVVLFPGGFGTMDEAYESLTLVQTGKSKPMPVVFLDAPNGTYWKTWERYVHDHLLRRKLVSPHDLSLFKVATSVDEAIDEVTQFYRLYHSSRFVGDRFVIRLMRPIDPALLATWTQDFADLLGSEQMVLGGPLDEERVQEPELDALPRLVLRYDPGKPGRLRELIDRVNREG